MNEEKKEGLNVNQTANDSTSNVQSNVTNTNSNQSNINQNVTRKKTNGKSIAGFVCSLVGILTCGLSSIVGLILSIIGLKESKRDNDSDGKGFSLAGIIISAILIFVYAIIIIIFSISYVGVKKTYNKAKEKINRIEDKYEFNYDKNIDDEETDEKESYGFNDAFEFDDLEIEIGSLYSIINLSNSYSEYNNKEVIKIPVTIKNLDDEPEKLNMFYYKFYGPKGTELQSLESYYSSDSIAFGGSLQPGASSSKYFFIPYDGDGEYIIAFDNYKEKINVKIDIIKK